MTKKARVLIVFAKHGTPTSTRFGGFVKRIQKNGGFTYAEVDYVALEDLIFRVYSRQKARVFDPERNIEVSDYSFVYFKSWQSMPDEASALAHYLEGIGVPYADTQVKGEMRTKTTNQMAMWAVGVPTPPSVWGSGAVLLNYISKKSFDYPVVIKAIDGEKGKENYLAHSRQEALTILKTSDHPMILQEFVPNEGDYRIGVYGGVARWGIYRRSGGTSHLNNTSAGGSAELLDIKMVDDTILHLAEDAAYACGLVISGVDVVQHAQTKQLYVFEANQGSQIVTGAFAASNMEAFDEGFESMVMRRSRKSKPKRLPIIGRNIDVTLLHSDVEMVFNAKVDTGAYRSAIGVEYTELRRANDGQEYLAYGVKNDRGAVAHFEEYEYNTVNVRNSFGHEENRFYVPIELVIFGVKYKTKATLANRTKLKRQILIGRLLIKDNFLVDVRYTKTRSGS